MLPGGWILTFPLENKTFIENVTVKLESKSETTEFMSSQLPSLKMAKLLSLLNCNYNQSVYKNTSENSEKHFQEAEVVSCSVNWTNSPNPKWFGSWRFNHSFSEWLQTAVKCDVNMLNWAIRSNVEMFVTKHLDIYLHFWSIIISSVDIMTVCT